MKKIALKHQEEKVTIQEVEQFESDHVFKLPNSYKQFLAQNNGGVPKEKIFWDGEIESGVFYFYPLKYGDTNALEHIIPVLHDNEEKILPVTYFPFARTAGGSIYAFSMESKNYGEVYIFHYDDSEPFKMANSFEEFINYLEEE